MIASKSLFSLETDFDDFSITSWLSHMITSLPFAVQRCCYHATPLFWGQKPHKDDIPGLLCTVTFLLLIASPGTALWGQSQKLIEMADTSHLPDNPFSHMHECLCLHVGILPFCCAQHKWKYEVSESRDFLLDWSNGVTEMELFSGCQHVP
jgi:hypothetical protein